MAVKIEIIQANFRDKKCIFYYCKYGKKPEQAAELGKVLQVQWNLLRRM